MKKQERRHFTPEQKSKILREHHLDKVPVSDLCEKYKLQPSVFYGWQRALFERAPQVFVESRTTPAETVKRELGGKVEQLEAKLAKKDGVIAELSEALVDLKKELGEL
jgi:transposase